MVRPIGPTSLAFLSASRVQRHRYPRFGLAAVADTTPATPKPIEVGRLRASRATSDHVCGTTALSRPTGEEANKENVIAL